MVHVVQAFIGLHALTAGHCNLQGTGTIHSDKTSAVSRIRLVSIVRRRPGVHPCHSNAQHASSAMAKDRLQDRNPCVVSSVASPLDTPRSQSLGVSLT